MKEDVLLEGEFPYWLPYQDLHTDTNKAVPRMGQVHRWFFLRIKASSTIDLQRATDQEFSNFRWVTFETAIEETSEHKRFVYEALKAYFEHVIQKIPR